MINKKKEYAIVIFILLLTLIICSYLVLNIVDILKYRGGRPEDIIYTNNNEGNVGYKVYLKSNSFINETYINNDYSFISSLVEYVGTSFSYNYKGNSNVNVIYDYYIKANIVSKYLSDSNVMSKPLWNKSFVLLDHKKGSANNSNISITENLNIGIDYYNNLLQEFNKSINIPLDSRLDVTLVMSIKGDIGSNKKIAKDHQITMSIPLGVKVFDIDVSKNFPEQEITYSKEQKNAETSYVTAIAYILLVITISGTAFYFAKTIINRGKNEYESKVNKLLKEYDDRIVTVSNFIRYEKLEIVNIPSFDELLTFSDETLEPIIYWEKRNNKHMEAWFSIIRDKVLFRYSISYDRYPPTNL